MTAVLKEKLVIVCSSSVLMFFCLKQSMEKVEEQFLFAYLQWDYKKIKEYGIKTRFLKNKIIFKVFLETSSLLNLKEVFFP